MKTTTFILAIVGAASAIPSWHSTSSAAQITETVSHTNLSARFVNVAARATNMTRSHVARGTLVNSSVSAANASLVAPYPGLNNTAVDTNKTMSAQPSLTSASPELSENPLVLNGSFTHAKRSEESTEADGCGRHEHLACCDRLRDGQVSNCVADEYCRRKFTYCCDNRAFYNGFKFDTRYCRKTWL